MNQWLWEYEVDLVLSPLVQKDVSWATESEGPKTTCRRQTLLGYMDSNSEELKGRQAQSAWLLKKPTKVIKYFTHFQRGQRLYKLENNLYVWFAPHCALWTSCQHSRVGRFHWKLEMTSFSWRIWISGDTGLVFLLGNYRLAPLSLILLPSLPALPVTCLAPAGICAGNSWIWLQNSTGSTQVLMVCLHFKHTMMIIHFVY